MKDHLRLEDLATTHSDGAFLVFLAQESLADAGRFTARLAAVAKSKAPGQVSRFEYAIVSYPRHGAEGDALIQAALGRLLDTPEQMDI